MKSNDIALAVINQIYEDMEHPNDREYLFLYDTIENICFG